MALGFTILGGAAGILSLVCFILVIVAMFQNDQASMGITCLVLFFCVGIGVLIAFVFGWIKSSEWGISNIMMFWTGAILVAIVCRIIAAAMGVGIASF